MIKKRKIISLLLAVIFCLSSANINLYANIENDESIELYEVNKESHEPDNLYESEFEKTPDADAYNILANFPATDEPPATFAPVEFETIIKYPDGSQARKNGLIIIFTNDLTSEQAASYLRNSIGSLIDTNTDLHIDTENTTDDSILNGVNHVDDLNENNNPKTDDIHIEQLYDQRIAVVTLPSEINANEIIQSLINDASIDFVQPDYIMEPLSYAIPEEQWALINYGQTINGHKGVPETDIGFRAELYNENTLDTVIAAVIDTAIDVNKLDLENKFLSGWDFVNNSPLSFNNGDPYHGTQISALIAANGEYGIAGAAKNVQILPLKFIQDGYGYTSDLLAAINYATANGAKIINCSWGSSVYNPILKNIIESNGDVLFVCAAGNNGDETPVYPASYGLPNVISAAAMDNTANIYINSNYGPLVDIAAPGVDIYTVAAGGGYTFISGTSASAGYLSAAAGIFLGANPDSTPAQVKSVLMNAAFKTDGLTGLIKSGGYLRIVNSYTATEPDEEFEIIDFNGLPPEIVVLLNSELSYNLLTAEQKELLTQYAFLREDTMNDCANAGLNIKNSIAKALIMQILDLDLVKSLEMIDAHDGESAALKNARYFREWQYRSVWLTGDFVNELIELMVIGYSAYETIISAVAADVLGVAYADAIYQDISAVMSAELSGFTDEDVLGIKQLSTEYCADAGVLADYIKNENITADELRERLMEYRNHTGIFIETSYSPLAGTPDEISMYYANSPFKFDAGASEGINFNSGALSYEDRIATIHGRGGFDLELVAQYSTDKASAQNIVPAIDKDFITQYILLGMLTYNFSYSLYNTSMYVNNGWIYYFGRSGFLQAGPDLWHTGTPYYNNTDAYAAYALKKPYLDGLSKYLEMSQHGCYNVGYYQSNLINKVVTAPQKNPMEYMGDGWNLKFNRVSLQNSSGYTTNQIFLHMEDGSTYQYEQKANSSNLKDYSALDMVFTLDPNSAGMAGSRYILTHNDGRKEYFNVNGHIIRTEDRFANRYNFAYTTNSGTYNGSINITDATGQFAASVVYASNLVTVNLPDNTSVKYGLTSQNNARVMSVKTDQLNRQTSFGYNYSAVRYNYIGRTSNGSSTINRHLLSSVTYPTGAVSSYAYNKTEGFIAKSGWFEYYRLSSRQDTAGGAVFNYAGYTYSSNNFAGHPNQTDASALPLNYTYDTTVTFNTGKKITHIFNNIHQLSKKTTYNGNNPKIEETLTYDANKHPKSYSEKIINGANSRSTTEYFDFDVYGNMLGYWNKRASGANDAEHKTTYTYGAYGIPLTKSYKTNASTTVTVTNTLTGAPIANKAIATASITQSGVGEVWREQYSYDATGLVLSKNRFINANNYIQTVYNYNFTTSGLTKTENTAGIQKTFVYDRYGRQTQFTDGKGSGHTTYFTYDAFGRLTGKTNPPVNGQNTSVSYAYNDSQRTMTMTNEIGYQIRTSYNQMGDPITVTDLTMQAQLSAYTYDAYSRPLTETAASNVTTYTYDFLNRIITKTITSKNNAPFSPYSEAYAYDDACPNPTAGNEIQAKLIKTIAGDTNTPQLRTVTYTNRFGDTVRSGYITGSTEILDSFVYDYAGNITQTLYDGKTKNYVYDYAGRLTKTTNPDGSVYASAYDWLGRKISETDPKNKISYYTYDPAGNLTQENLPFDGAARAYKTYQYDANGNLTSERMNNNKPGLPASEARTDYTYDNRNRMTKADSYDGAVIKSTVTCAYDGAGNVTSKTTGGNRTTAYNYDHRGRLTILTDPMGWQETYAYDNADNMISKTDRNGHATVNAYDALNRLINTTVNGGGKSESVSYSYGKTGSQVSESNANVTVTNLYDDAGRLVKQTEPNGVTKDYTYDQRGNRLTFVLRHNNAVTLSQSYQYDSMYRLQNVYESGALQATYGYDANGNRSSLAYPNGTSTAYTYNDANLVTNLVNKQNGAVISSYAYTYYTDGNQATKTENTGRVTAYAYDGLGRLTNETETTAGTAIIRGYAYDAYGNRSQTTVTEPDGNYTIAYAYDANNRLLTETKTGTKTDVTKYSYDRNGNQLSKTGYTLGDAGETGSVGIYLLGVYAEEHDFTAELSNYDLFNRLVKTENASGIFVYQYKPNGFRHSKAVNGDTVTHIWDGNSIVLDLNQSDAVKNKYVRGAGLIKDQNGLYFVFNAHGDVVQLINVSGVVVKTYHYDAFGVETDADPADANPWRYCCEYWDAETKTYYLRFRSYDPKTGRFTSEDPIRDGLNWYTYAGSNPVFFIDPWGLFSGIYFDMYLMEAPHDPTTREYYLTLWEQGGILNDSITPTEDPKKTVMTSDERKELESATALIRSQSVFESAEIAAFVFGMNTYPISRSTYGREYGNFLGPLLPTLTKNPQIDLKTIQNAYDTASAGGVMKPGAEMSALIYKCGNYFTYGTVYTGDHSFVGMGILRDAAANYSNLYAVVHTHPFPGVDYGGCNCHNIELSHGDTYLSDYLSDISGKKVSIYAIQSDSSGYGFLKYP